jgi:DNA polymerase-3 subunit chi
MSEFSFYQLLRTPLEQALPKILEKVRELGLRAVVVVSSQARVESLSQVLWTYDPGSFLAHGSARDGYPGDQPIWLTDSDENPNGAEVVVLADGATVASPERYQRCIEIFDGRDETATGAARARYRQAKDGGHALKYFRQSERGWELGASSG